MAVQASWCVVCVMLVAQVQVIQTIVTKYDWQPDIVYTPSQLHNDIRVYRDPSEREGPYFSYQYLHDDYLYVGAMERIYRFDIDGSFVQSVIKSEVIPPLERASAECDARGGGLQCKNHIRFIGRARDQDTLYVCGTGASVPHLYNVSLDLSGPSSSHTRYNSGTGICPEGPWEKPVAQLVEDGPTPGRKSVIFSAVSGTDPKIFRPTIQRNSAEKYNFLRTQRAYATSLLNPKFVKVIPDGDFVYYFFCEVLEQSQNVVISRIARVCKRDVGGEDSSFMHLWTSYFKAKVDCTLGGADAFSLRTLVDVQLVDDVFYAAFSTEVNDGILTYGTDRQALSVSAVCTFTKRDITSVFTGTRDGAGDCTVDSKSLSLETLQHNRANPEMPSTLHSAPTRPALYIRDASIIHMHVQPHNSDVTVFFLVAANGKVFKVASWDAGQQENILAIYDLFNGVDTHVYFMVASDDHLFLTTNTTVVKLSMSQCHHYTSCNRCAKDPYCGWDPSANMCVEDQRNTIQNIQGDSLNSCGRDCRINSEHHSQVQFYGDSTVLHCNSYCEVQLSDITWTTPDGDVTAAAMLNPGLITNDQQQATAGYRVGSDGSLYVPSVTSEQEQEYRCKVRGVTVAKHEVRVQTDACNGDKDCLWEAEFRKWCKEFDSYMNNANEWVCVKDQCENDTCTRGSECEACLASKRSDITD